MLQRMDSERVMSFATTMMTQLSNAMASIVLLVMTMVFMLFEVRHVPYKMRFALNNPQIHIAGLHRALKGVSLSGAKNAAQSVDGRDRLGGAGHYGHPVCAHVGWRFCLITCRISDRCFRQSRRWFRLCSLTARMSGCWSAPVSRRAYGYRQHSGTTHDGSPTRYVDTGGLSFVTDLGLVARSGGDAAVPLTSVCKIWMETTTGGSKLAIMLGPGRPKNRLPG
jgi:hypothetical protein